MSGHITENGDFVKPKAPRLNNSERLLRRLRAMGIEIPPGSYVHRTRAGPHQRAAGAFIWLIHGPRHEDLRIGGFVPLPELLRGRLMITRGARDYDYVVEPYAPQTWRDLDYVAEAETVGRRGRFPGGGRDSASPAAPPASPPPGEDKRQR